MPHLSRAAAGHAARRFLEKRWIVLRAGADRRWGSEIRRQMIFDRLAAETGGKVVDSWPQMQQYVEWGVWPARLWPRRRGFLVASEQPPETVFPWIRRNLDPLAVAIYDDPVAQNRALGVEMEPGLAAELDRRRRLAMATFPWYVVPTRSFAELSGLDLKRVIVGGNGTLSNAVQPGPWPSAPAIGFVSGAAPGRGIETLVEACRLIRGSNPDLRLYLWLVATSPRAEAYLGELTDGLRADPWVKIASIGHADLGAALAAATILCIPHPPNEYMDVALPVKLFDSMAAGRPLVVTPRLETAAIVRGHGVGLVTAGDGPSDLAQSFERLLNDQALAHRMGQAARDTAVREYDWNVVGGKIAAEVLGRAGRPTR